MAAEKSSSSSDSKSDSSKSDSDSKSAPEPEKKELSDEEKSRKETKPGTADGGTTPALQTPKDETKFGSGGGTEAAKAPGKPGEDKPKFFASPLARKLALERGVPLAEIKGTGPEGRIVKVRQLSMVRVAPADCPTGGR